MIDLAFEALADGTRRTILRRLSERGPLSTGELLEGLGMSRQGASRHLDVLESSGLVRSVKQGRVVVRELDRERLKAMTLWINDLAMTWDERLARLKASYEVEDGV